MNKKEIPVNRRTVPITIAVPTLDRWLRYQYQTNGITEVEIEMGAMDTMMIIKLKGEDFPEFDSSLSKIDKTKVSVQHD